MESSIKFDYSNKTVVITGAASGIGLDTILFSGIEMILWEDRRVKKNTGGQKAAWERYYWALFT